GLLPGLVETRLVLLLESLRLELRLLGPLDAALDGVGPLGQRLLDVRHQLPGERAEDDGERDDAENELGAVRHDRILIGQNGDVGQVGHWDASLPEWRHLPKTNGMTMPISASASVSAKPMYMFCWIRLRASGCRAIASTP